MFIPHESFSDFNESHNTSDSDDSSYDREWDHSDSCLTKIKNEDHKYSTN